MYIRSAARDTSYFKNIRRGIGHAIGKRRFHYDFYHISDVRTDVHLAHARQLLHKYFQLPNGPKSKELERTLDAVQLQAANECAKWITPTIELLRNRLKERPILKPYWPRGIQGHGKIPLVITSAGHAERQEFIAQAYTCSQLPKIVLAPLWCYSGSALCDKDVLRYTLGHETYHILEAPYHHATQGSSNQSHKQHEFDADVYGCKLSKSACIGLLKFSAKQSHIKSIYNMQHPDNHPSPADQRVMALSQAQGTWYISLEECNEYMRRAAQSALSTFQKYHVKKNAQ